MINLVAGGICGGCGALVWCFVVWWFGVLACGWRGVFAVRFGFVGDGVFGCLCWFVWVMWLCGLFWGSVCWWVLCGFPGCLVLEAFVFWV